MAQFESSEQLKEVLGGFFAQLTQHPDISRKLGESKLVIRFAYEEPKLTVTVDCSQSPIELRFDDTSRNPEVEMFMKADIAHQFWFGKLNLLTALTRKQIVAKGPIPKVLKLLPAIKPAYELYPQYLEASGNSKFITF